MAGKNVLELNEDNFQAEVLDSDKAVLVDFWASWCGPCRMIAPVVEELANDVAGTAKVGKVNVDENQALAAKYNVRSIPTLIVFKNGEVVEQRVGAADKASLKKMLGL